MQRTKELCVLAVLLCAYLVAAYDPVADPSAVIVDGNARFTVLTSRMIRMEWSDGAAFVDEPSFTFVNRKLSVPKFEKSIEDNVLTLKTEDVELTYQIGSAFSEDTLKITLLSGAKKDSTWVPGQKDTGNLFGTIRTLDGSGAEGYVDLDCANQPKAADLHCTYAFISRLGWSVVDDSEMPLFDNNQEWPWATVRSNSSTPAVDWYFFGYGLDFRAALHDFTLVAGDIPLPPRYVFGVWWSRYWAFSDEGLKDIVSEYKMHNIPLDVLVVDMDWHMTFYKEAYAGVKDQAGQELGWTGYTWDKNLFPDPQEFLQWTEDQNLKVTMNLHPASGVQPHEELYPEMARAMGIDPSTKKYVPCDLQNKTFMGNLLDIMLKPLKAEGVDFWWLDWQQGENWPGLLPGQNPTFWLNYVFASKSRPADVRPLIFHRWGGLGNHRYQIGFSGDTTPSWDSLTFQPYFTATAANVGYTFWSHDIGGHTAYSPPELYTRWVQWGAFSPIFRTHCTKSPENDRRIWAYPLENFVIMRDAIRLRAALLPYIYSAARDAHNTGIGMLRHLYIDYSDDETSFEHTDQYLFGDSFIVAPITSPMDEDKAFVERSVWLPAGDWVDFYSGHQYTGPVTFTRSYTLSEFPVFVKANSIIPMTQLPESSSKLTGSAGQPSDAMVLSLFPGTPGKAVSASTQWTEDDGDSADYKSAGRFATTKAAMEVNADFTKLDLHVSPPIGSYKGQPKARSWEVRVRGSWPATSVEFQGKAVPYNMDATALPSWHYDGSTLTLVVRLPATPNEEAIHVAIALGSVADRLSANVTRVSAVGNGDAEVDVVSRIKRALKAQELLDNCFPEVFQEDYEALINLAETGQRLTSRPTTTVEEIAHFEALHEQAIDQVKALKPGSSMPEGVIPRCLGLLQQ